MDNNYNIEVVAVAEVAIVTTSVSLATSTTAAAVMTSFSLPVAETTLEAPTIIGAQSNMVRIGRRVMP